MSVLMQTKTFCHFRGEKPKTIIKMLQFREIPLPTIHNSCFIMTSFKTYTEYRKRQINHRYLFHILMTVVATKQKQMIPEIPKKTEQHATQTGNNSWHEAAITINSPLAERTWTTVATVETRTILKTNTHTLHVHE